MYQSIVRDSSDEYEMITPKYNRATLISNSFCVGGLEGKSKLELFPCMFGRFFHVADYEYLSQEFIHH